MARALHEEACAPTGPCRLDQFKLFEIVLAEYQFIVVSAEHGQSRVHKGPESNKQIMPLMHDGHFNVITKLPGYFNSDYFCLDCGKAYSMENFAHHNWNKTKCPACFQKKLSKLRVIQTRNKLKLSK